MIIKQIMDICKEYEEELMWDTECSYHYYEISYKEYKLIIKIIEEYDDYSGGPDKVITTNIDIIEEIKCSMKDYAQTLIYFYEDKIRFIKYNEAYYGDIIDKIDVELFIGDK